VGAKGDVVVPPKTGANARTGTQSVGRGDLAAVIRKPIETGRIDQGALTVRTQECQTPFWVSTTCPLAWARVDDVSLDASLLLAVRWVMGPRERVFCSGPYYDWLWECIGVWTPAINNLQYLYESGDSSKFSRGNNSLGNYLSYCFPYILNSSNNNHYFFYSTILLSWDNITLYLLKQLRLLTALLTSILLEYYLNMNTKCNIYPLNLFDVLGGHVEVTGSQHTER
jgi:hypothetical protein